MLTLEILRVLRYSFVPFKWNLPVPQARAQISMAKETENLSISVVSAMNDISV